MRNVKVAPAIRPVSEMVAAVRDDFDRTMNVRRERNDAAKTKRKVGAILLRLAEQDCTLDGRAYRDAALAHAAKADAAKYATRNLDGRLRALGWAVMTEQRS